MWTWFVDRRQPDTAGVAPAYHIGGRCAGPRARCWLLGGARHNGRHWHHLFAVPCLMSGGAPCSPTLSCVASAMGWGGVVALHVFYSQGGQLPLRIPSAAFLEARLQGGSRYRDEQTSRLQERAGRERRAGSCIHVGGGEGVSNVPMTSIHPSRKFISFRLISCLPPRERRRRGLGLGQDRWRGSTLLPSMAGCTRLALFIVKRQMDG